MILTLRLTQIAAWNSHKERIQWYQLECLLSQGNGLEPELLDFKQQFLLLSIDLIKPGTLKRKYNDLYNFKYLHKIGI